MISKQIAFFWSGDALSWLRYLTLRTFCDLNPTWEIYLYLATSTVRNTNWQQTPETQDYMNYSGKDWLPEVEKNLPVKIRTASRNVLRHLDPIHQCDMFQWWWLSTHGGWYSDLDILYTQSMGSLYDCIEDADMVFSLPRGDFTIGFLGSKPKNRFYECLFTMCAQTTSRGFDPLANFYQGFGAQLAQLVLDERRGPDMVNKIEKVFGHSSYVIDSIASVYPWNWTGVDKIWKESHDISNRQLGIHWFAGAEISQQMNAKITPDTVKKFPCTLTNHIKN